MPNICTIYSQYFFKTFTRYFFYNIYTIFVQCLHNFRTLFGQQLDNVWIILTIFSQNFCNICLTILQQYWLNFWLILEHQLCNIQIICICICVCAKFMKYLYTICIIFAQFFYNIFTIFKQYLHNILNNIHTTFCTIFAQQLYNICSVVVQYLLHICTIFKQNLYNICTKAVKYLFLILQYLCNIYTIFE